ncbi:unnamed protein product [Amoebophrya sp. A120]|nr:unnamed protein product [Amoebophrya sp. A120]|eukprot:GSA120T00024675001.1
MASGGPIPRGRRSGGEQLQSRPSGGAATASSTKSSARPLEQAVDGNINLVPVARTLSAGAARVSPASGAAGIFSSLFGRSSSRKTDAARGAPEITTSAAMGGGGGGIVPTTSKLGVLTGKTASPVEAALRQSFGATHLLRQSHTATDSRRSLLHNPNSAVAAVSDADSALLRTSVTATGGGLTTTGATAAPGGGPVKKTRSRGMKTKDQNKRGGRGGQNGTGSSGGIISGSFDPLNNSTGTSTAASSVPNSLPHSVGTLSSLQHREQAGNGTLFGTHVGSRGGPPGPGGFWLAGGFGGAVGGNSGGNNSNIGGSGGSNSGSAGNSNVDLPTVLQRVTARVTTLEQQLNQIADFQKQCLAVLSSTNLSSTSSPSNAGGNGGTATAPNGAGAAAGSTASSSQTSSVSKMASLTLEAPQSSNQRRGSSSSRRGSTASRRGSAVSRRGSTASRRGSVEKEMNQQHGVIPTANANSTVTIPGSTSLPLKNHRRGSLEKIAGVLNLDRLVASTSLMGTSSQNHRRASRTSIITSSEFYRGLGASQTLPGSGGAGTGSVNLRRSSNLGGARSSLIVPGGRGSVSLGGPGSSGAAGGPSGAALVEIVSHESGGGQNSSTSSFGLDMNNAAAAVKKKLQINTDLNVEREFVQTPSEDLQNSSTGGGGGTTSSGAGGPTTNQDAGPPGRSQQQETTSQEPEVYPEQ